jgi:hypothetical protein
MQERFDEIRHAIQNIQRNLTLLATDATIDQMIAIEQSEQDIEEFQEYSIGNVKKAFKR